MTEVPLSIIEAGAALRAGTLTSVELTRAVIDRAEQLDEQVGAYLARFDDQALQAAEVADAELASGADRGPLHGIPFGVKDILATREGPTTAQSLILDPAWGAGREGPAVARIRATGAVITGKLTTMEFAVGLPDRTKPFPLPRNPWDLDTWPGGSSSGTGVAVAAGMVLAGFGTDTGGSIRIPAGFCGVSGLMPTYGRVPTSGCVPLGYSLDHIGPLARTAADCAAVLSIIAGHHASDPTSSPLPVPDYTAAMVGHLEGVRIGIDRVHHSPEGADPALAPVIEAVIEQLAGLGATVVEVSLPHYPETASASMITMLAEALAYHHNDLAERWEDYGAGTRLTIARGALASAADYVQAQRVRRVVQAELAALFGGVDAVIMPMASLGSPRYADLDAASVVPESLFTHVFTPYWDAVGNPVLCVPMGFTEGGLPLGLQIAGRPFDESTVLRVGDAFQQVTDWHRQVPALVEQEAGLEQKAVQA